jgi:TonB family protein
MALSLLSLSDPGQRSVPAKQLPPSDYPLELQLVKRDARSYSQLALIAAGSLLVHLLVFTFVVEFPSLVQRSEPEHLVVEHKTPLYFPRELITQRAPNRQKVSKEIDLASLLDSQTQQRAQRASPGPSVRPFELPPRIMPDAPNLAMNQNPGDPGASAIGGLPSPAPPPKAPVAIVPRQQPPGDVSQSIPAPALPDLPGQSGAQHAAIELESDPQGADFKPYLTRILEIVRANWQRVLPEGARTGRLHGRTVVEFIINRDGTIPKVVTAQPSGLNQLDLAASTSLVMSSPLPSLPAEYRGFQIRLAFTFAYNMPAR